MGAPQNIYVTYNAGSPNGGTGTVGDPYRSHTYAFTQVTHDTDNGTKWNWDTGVTFPITSTFTPPGTPTYVAPHIHVPWGSGRYDFNGNNAAVGFFNGTHNHFISGRFRGFLGQTGILFLGIFGTGCILRDCLFESGGVNGCISFNGIECCENVFSGFTSGTGIFSVAGMFERNILICNGGANVSGARLQGPGTPLNFRRNLILEPTGTGYGIGIFQGGHVENNTVVKTTTKGSSIGIWGNGTSDVSRILDNIVVGFFNGIQMDANWDLSVLSGNAFWDCTNIISQASNADIKHTYTVNETLSEYPFTQQGGDSLSFTYYTPKAIGNLRTGGRFGFSKGAVQTFGGGYPRGRVVNAGA